MGKFFLGFFLVVFLVGCSPMLHTRGNLVNAELLEKIKVNETSQADVLALLGPPSTQTLFTEEGWYYIGEKTLTKAFFDPEIIERVVVEIHFSQDKKVSSVKVSKNKGYKVEPCTEKTPTHGRDPSALSEIFGNLGRYNETESKNRKK